MLPSTQRRRIYAVTVILVLSMAGSASAQTTNPVNNIPTQVTQSAENRAVTKSNTVSNQAMDKLDSASNKAFRGFTHMFKKKNKTKPGGTDSTGVHTTDTTTVRKTSFITNPKCKPSPGTA